MYESVHHHCTDADCLVRRYHTALSRGVLALQPERHSSWRPIWISRHPNGLSRPALHQVPPQDSLPKLLLRQRLREEADR